MSSKRTQNPLDRTTPSAGRFVEAFVAPWGALFACLVGLLLSAAPLAARDGRIGGRVLQADEPAREARVFAYETTTFRLTKMLTDDKGRYLFESLPVGLYRIIAFKPGFLPAVDMKMLASSDAREHLDLFLLEDEVGDVRQAESYWDARRRIPPDVLREISNLALREDAQLDGHRTAELLEARLSAQSGYEQIGASSSAQVTGADIGLRANVAGLEVGVDGRYQELARSPGDTAMPHGETRSLAMRVDGENSRLKVTGASSELRGAADQLIDPIGLEHYRLSWSGKAGEGTSAFSARFLDQRNYHLHGFLDPADLPAASRTLQLEGSYERPLTERTSFTTGLSYRERDGDITLPERLLEGAEDQTLGLFGTAKSQIRPKVMVEYGIYSTVQEGILSLMPHSSLIVDLGSEWSARTSISKRIEDEEDTALLPRWSSTAFNDRSTCRTSSEACYEVSFSRGAEDRDSRLRLGAVHREYAETLRLYFNDDFFNRLESIFVVRGDQVPELQLQMSRRLAPKILATLQSNVAAGGGGIFYATDAQRYENRVRYLVTSLDTQFQSTSTGVFIAFHHLEQDLVPIRGGSAQGDGPDVEMQRLQLMLTQDLSILSSAAGQWAVRLNMEVSRGATPYTLEPSDEVFKKLTGGISVSF